MFITKQDSIDGYVTTKRIKEISYVYELKRPYFNFEGDQAAYNQAVKDMEAEALALGGNAVVGFRMKISEQNVPGTTRSTRKYPFPTPLDYTPGGRRTVHTPGYTLVTYICYGTVVRVEAQGNV